MPAVLSKKLSVEFHHRKDDGRVKIAKVILKFPERNWTWTATLKSFEVIHGLSRVMRLVPDKLATALAINMENLPDPDDGSFLIKLVEDLLKVYVDRNRLSQEVEADSSGNLETLVVQLGGEPVAADFAGEENLTTLLDTYSGKLHSFNELLRDRSFEQFRSEGDLLVRLSDDVLLVCHAYLDLAHLVWIETNKSGAFNQEDIEAKKAELVGKLCELGGKLAGEYSELTTNKSGEE